MPQGSKYPNNHIHTQNLYKDHYEPKPKYLIIGYWVRALSIVGLLATITGDSFGLVALRLHLNNWVPGALALIVVVQFLGKYVIPRYLHCWG